jgi:hypothetical protein
MMIATRTSAAWLLLAAMAGGLVLYITLHSPLRDVAAAMLLGRATHTSYFAAATFHGLGSYVDAGAALIAVIAAAFAAARVADLLAMRRYERPLVFGVGAFGLIAVPAATVATVAGAVHLPLLQPPVGPLLVALPALVVVARAVAGGWRPRVPQMAPLTRTAAAFWALAVALLVASAAVSLLQPPTGFDALAYHGPLAVYLWRDGNATSFLDRSVSGFALALPASAELWFGLLLMIGGERLANLGQVPFALLGALGVQALARRHGARGSTAGIAGAAFLLAPMVVLQAGLQLNDVAASALILCGAAFASAPTAEWTRGRASWIGLAAGLAVATKLAVLPAAAAVLAFAMYRGLAATPARARHATAVMIVAVGVAVAPWWARNIVRYGNPIYPAALPLIGRGVVVGGFAQKDDWFVPARVAWPFYPAIEPLSEQSGFGPLLLVGALPGLLVAITRRRRGPLVLLGGVAVLSLPSWWVLTQHEPRHLLAVAGLGFAFLPASLAVGTPRIRRAALLVTGAAALFTALSVVDQGLLPRMRQRMERARFYDDVWSVDPVVAGAPDTEPLLYNTGYALLSYAGDYPLLGPSLRRVLFTVDTDATTDAIVHVMREARVRYAYVPASAASQPEVMRKYAPAYFDLERVSEVPTGERAGTRRYLYRLRDQVVSR